MWAGYVWSKEQDPVKLEETQLLPARFLCLTCLCCLVTPAHAWVQPSLAGGAVGSAAPEGKKVARQATRHDTLHLSATARSKVQVARNRPRLLALHSSPSASHLHTSSRLQALATAQRLEAPRPRFAVAGAPSASVSGAHMTRRGVCSAASAALCLLAALLGSARAARVQAPSPSPTVLNGGYNMPSWRTTSVEPWGMRRGGCAAPVAAAVVGSGTGGSVSGAAHPGLSQ